MSQHSNHTPEVVEESNGSTLDPWDRYLLDPWDLIAGTVRRQEPIILPAERCGTTTWHVTYVLGQDTRRRKCISAPFLDRANAVAYAARILARGDHEQPARCVSILSAHVPA
ncbi:MAG: hypothetical protein ACRDHG_12770 [Anaerolineales bacterium]